MVTCAVLHMEEVQTLSPLCLVSTSTNVYWRMFYETNRSLALKDTEIERNGYRWGWGFRIEFSTLQNTFLFFCIQQQKKKEGRGAINYLVHNTLNGCRHTGENLFFER